MNLTELERNILIHALEEWCDRGEGLEPVEDEPTFEKQGDSLILIQKLSGEEDDEWGNAYGSPMYGVPVDEPCLFDRLSNPMKVLFLIGIWALSPALYVAHCSHVVYTALTRSKS